MTTISIRKRTYQVPTEWNDVTPVQLVKLVKIIYSGHPVPYGYLLMLKTLANIPTIFWNSLQVDEIDEFLYLPQTFINTRLTRQLLPPVGGSHYGPADGFNNLLMCEFVFTEDFFFRFKDDETNLEHLDNLVGVLFRPARTTGSDGKPYDMAINPDGDVRRPFNGNECQHQAKTVIKHWDVHLKMAILTWYEHNRLQLIDDFPAVFAGGEGEPAKYGLLTMMRNVAQGGTHGDFNRVENLFVKMVMIELDEMLLEAEQIEKLKPKP